ncbi:MAG: glycerol-3-phosphate 1-O-acyltransferase PlsY [Clostridiales bacterium]|nr:glycerol-3-phosphate 1-O-acyltransferase PlsY [Clostridiales bacterium]
MVYAVIAITAVIAYLLGSVNSAIIVGKLHKIDIREHGSGNAGLTNTLRVLGKKSAVCVLLGDILKGVVAIGIAIIISKFDFYPDEYFYVITQLAGVAVVLGHIFPVYYGFKGGKGVLTSITVMFMINWQISLICLLLFIIIVAITKFVSLGSILAAFAFPCLVFFSDKISFLADRKDMLIFSIILAAIVIIKHRTNIVRLVQGKENKLSFKKK